MNFLVLGASGMAGHAVGLWLKERGHEVLGYSTHSTELFDCIKGDVRDISRLENIIDCGSFDAVVNLIALLNENSERYKADAVYLNSWFPHILSDICEKRGIRMIHMSTDGIFAGDNGPYSEEDLPDDRSFYGRTKALGEPSGKTALTLRTCIVGPDTRAEGVGLLNWFMKQRSRVNGYLHVLWTGVTTVELARIIESAVKSKHLGVVQAVPNISISKYELLKLFNAGIRRYPIQIDPVPYPRIDRRLVPSKSELCKNIPNYKKQIETLADWIETHPSIYPNYYQ